MSSKQALVVYESMFGNTREIARAVATGLSGAADCTVVEVGAAPTVVDAHVDLLVIGAPTHAFGLSSPASRYEAQAESSQPVISAELGVREWLAALVLLSGTVRVAAFDTHARQKWVPGSAAHRIAQAVHHKGVSDLSTRTFYVAGRTGPVIEGQLRRAREWGRSLGRQLVDGSVAPTVTR